MGDSTRNSHCTSAVRALMQHCLATIWAVLIWEDLAAEPVLAVPIKSSLTFSRGHMMEDVLNSSTLERVQCVLVLWRIRCVAYDRPLFCYKKSHSWTVTGTIKGYGSSGAEMGMGHALDVRRRTLSLIWFVGSAIYGCDSASAAAKCTV